MNPSHTRPIRVFLIDDHASILWGLERLIQSGAPLMQPVGSATACDVALERLDAAAPDVILLDMDLGRESGLDAIPRLLSRSQAKILVLTGLRDKTVHDRAVLAGARGVVEKEAPAEVILRAVAKVHEGELWLDRAATGRIFAELAQQGPAKAPDPEQQKIATLTDREREIVAHIAGNAGGTAKHIALALHISDNTLRNHLTSIYNKLGVANRLELFAYAHRHGLDRFQQPPVES
ncbi:MAG TPA: response regulator transcription factor [Noviherbaspirillum sp.]|uniref:response regulator transcription factor n=1 Tax=Noviherbaspirillum sp. TaxID=1926288 RepID=UPI002B46C0D1|nr:response regulator transcription factor [Noviherbaspirillum sp.]HJV86411.1 response regulator transcription factor [Noviherbaspirillum sp.]